MLSIVQRQTSKSTHHHATDCLNSDNGMTFTEIECEFHEFVVGDFSVNVEVPMAYAFPRAFATQLL